MNGCLESSPSQKIVQNANRPIGTKIGLVKLTQEKVREMFNYDPETGILTRRFKSGYRKRLLDVGSVAGCMTAYGYLRTRVYDKAYYNHIIIWVWYYGYVSENQIDHIDRNRSNNAISNLREVGQSCNTRNSKIDVRNKTGVKGVSRRVNGQLEATIKPSPATGNKRVYYGDDLTEVVAHRLAAEQCIGWDGCDSCSSAFLYMQEYVKSRK